MVYFNPKGTKFLEARKNWTITNQSRSLNVVLFPSTRISWRTIGTNGDEINALLPLRCTKRDFNLSSFFVPPFIRWPIGQKRLLACISLLLAVGRALDG